MAIRTKSEVWHILQCVAGELLCEPVELAFDLPELMVLIRNGADYETCLSFANENC